MRILQKEVLKRFKEISQKLNVPLQDVIDVESSIWKLVKEKIAEGKRGDIDTFRNIYIKNLGTFYANKGKFKYVNKNVNK